MKHNLHINARYDLTAYDGQEVIAKTITKEQLSQIQAQHYDYFFSKTLGRWAFRSSDGQWICHENARWPGIGETCIRVTQAVQMNPGEFQTPDDIAELTGYDTLRNHNALSARLKAIREAHKESHRHPNFFLSRRGGGYGIAWNPLKTWCWVERIRPGSID